jgi:superfamily II DNA or RNA helicase
VTAGPELWPHQVQAIEHTLKHWEPGRGGGAAVFAGIGTGKSRIAIEACRGLPRVLVVCGQKIAENVWKTQWPMWDSGRAVCLIHKGPVARRTRQLRALRLADPAPHSGPIVVVVNYEAMYREPLSRELEGIDWSALVVDESHRIQRPGGKQSKWLARLATSIPRRLLLTGTPISGAQGPFGIWAQYRCADPTIYQSSYSGFRTHYSRPVAYGQPYDYMLPDRGGAPRPWEFQRLADLTERMGSIAFQVRTEDVLELPDHVHVRRVCELEPRARKIYRALARHMIADVQDGLVTAANALVRMRRLQQVTGGTTKRDDGTEVEVSQAKRTELVDVLSDVAPTEPVVVFGLHHSDLDSIHAACRTLGRGSLELSGRTDDLSRWVAAEAPILAVQQQSGSEGVDLTRARLSVFYSLSFSLMLYAQACGRTLRPGQHRSVVYLHLVCASTVDEEIYKALARREDVVGAVLSAMRNADMVTER